MRQNTVFGLVLAGLLVAAPNVRATDPDADVTFPAHQAAIPAGTIINQTNWQQFKDYMPVGMQALWSGKYFWKIPEEGEIVVGQTVSIPTPKKYAQDTERYAAQVSLVHTAWGGTIPTNYVAGLPFPHPSGPDAGDEILYNYYYRYTPQFQNDRYRVVFEDRFNNLTWAGGWQSEIQLTHLSDPGAPITSPLAASYFRSNYVEVMEPEQSKYTVQLITFADDPSKIGEVYAFVPSLRRSLRLSSAARCAPELGSDYVVDDGNANFGGIPTDFHKYLRPSWWPKPIVGKWELRDVAVLYMTRLADRGAAGYCYGARIAYVDKETWQIMWVDLYDSSLKLWKVMFTGRRPYPIPNSGGDVALASYGGGVFNCWDLQNEHLSFTIQPVMKYNSDVPVQFQNIPLYAYPSGLAQVMQ